MNIEGTALTTSLSFADFISFTLLVG